jgi:hypothetical protein
MDTVCPFQTQTALTRFRPLALLGLMLSIATTLATPSQAHPDHQQVPSGTTAAPDHAHPHQGQQPHQHAH